MRGIQEEDAEFWQLLQHQQTTGDEVEIGGPMGIGRRAGYRSPARLQFSIKASFSRSCPCLSLAAMRPERDGQSAATNRPSPDYDDVDNSKHRRLRSVADRSQQRVTPN